MTEKRWRSAAAAVLITLGCLFFVLSIFTFWLKAVVLDTDSYVATVAPLAADPAIQNAVANRISGQLIDSTDLEQRIEGVLPPPSDMLAPVMTQALQDGVQRAITDEISSDRFQKLWVDANRASHQLLINVLLGNGGAISAPDGKVTLDLGTVVADIRDRLSQSGLAFVNVLPELNSDVQITLFQSPKVAAAERALRLLDRLGWVLPAVTLGLFALAVWAIGSGRRQRALVWIGMGIAAAVVLTLIAMSGLRSHYLDSLDPGIDRSALRSALDIVLASLRSSLRAGFAGGVLLAAGAFAAGASAAAIKMRRSVTEELHRAGEEIGTGRFGRWFARHRTGLRVVGLAAALIYLASANQVTVAMLVMVAVLLLVWLGAIELLSSSARG